ncbi:MAG TPA: hypothetical protein VFY21_03010, partial [Xanthobacteraceae bacterium]|nr:hypothetical protein [Xanthobacteraceae bacterium]
MEQIASRDLKRVMKAKAVAAAMPVPAAAKPAPLGPLAAKIAAEPVAPAISQVVLAGVVRFAEFTAVSLLGLVIYWLYVNHPAGFAWEYLGAIIAVSTAAILTFQAAELYDTVAMRTHVHQLSRI